MISSVSSQKNQYLGVWKCLFENSFQIQSPCCLCLLCLDLFDSKIKTSKRKTNFLLNYFIDYSFFLFYLISSFLVSMHEKWFNLDFFLTIFTPSFPFIYENYFDFHLPFASICSFHKFWGLTIVEEYFLCCSSSTFNQIKQLNIYHVFFKFT